MDGYPRTLAAGRSAFGRSPAIANRRSSSRSAEAEAVERLLSRLTCRDCGAIYNQRNKPPKVAGVCDICGGSVERRADDNDGAVRQRFQVYAERTLPVIEYYERMDVLARVDGSGAAAPVYEKIKGLDRMILLKTDHETRPDARRQPHRRRGAGRAARRRSSPGSAPWSWTAGPSSASSGSRACPPSRATAAATASSPSRPPCAPRSTARWCTASLRPQLRAARRGHHRHRRGRHL